MTTNAYPLQWPIGWKRTEAVARRRAPYRDPSFAADRDDIVRQIGILKGRDVVVSSGIALRRDGLPYAGLAEPADPGIAVYWTDRRGRPCVMAADAFRTVRENLHAVRLALEAFRQLERTGASQVLDRAFEGLAALPANAGPTNGRETWRDVLGIGAGPVDEEAIRTAYAILARRHHPDRGGTHEAMAAINLAFETGLRAVS